MNPKAAKLAEKRGISYKAAYGILYYLCEIPEERKRKMPLKKEGQFQEGDLREHPDSISKAGKARKK